MKSFRRRSFFSWTLAVCVVAACGGRVDSVSGSSDDADAGGGSSSGGGGGGGSGRDGGRISDAATKPDANVNVCIDISTSSFDTSCGTDDDCIDVTVGHLCSTDECWCGGAAISATEQSRYDETIAPVSTSTVACPCPFLGRPRCVLSQCVFCSSFDDGSNPAGCPDAG